MNGRSADRTGSAAGRTTLAQLARSLKVDVREVSRTARLVLGLAPAQARDRELVAATRAIDRLRDDDLPEGFDDFDRIVVDEVQDLTLLESAVVVELCRAVGRRHGRAPLLLMAGDAGQTVRPTAFDWGPLSDLLARRVGVPARFHLEEHLRCPSRIAEVVERSVLRVAPAPRATAPAAASRLRSAPAGAQTIRDRVYVPLYPLAESLVTNWWFLLHEVGNPVKNHDQAFKRRHALVSARDGYAFPTLHVTSSGSRMLLAWMPDSFLWTRLEYRGSDQTWIDTHEFRESCADLVDRVVRRLAAYGIEGTLLQEEWASIQTADRDERLFCKTAAALGWDPYALSDSQQAAVLRLEGVLTALQPGHATRLPLEHVRAACAPTPWAGDSPWQAGYALVWPRS